MFQGDSGGTHRFVIYFYFLLVIKDNVRHIVKCNETSLCEYDSPKEKRSFRHNLMESFINGNRSSLLIKSSTYIH